MRSRLFARRVRAAEGTRRYDYSAARGRTFPTARVKARYAASRVLDRRQADFERGRLASQGGDLFEAESRARKRQPLLERLPEVGRDAATVSFGQLRTDDVGTRGISASSLDWKLAQYGVLGSRSQLQGQLQVMKRFHQSDARSHSEQ